MKPENSPHEQAPEPSSLNPAKSQAVLALLARCVSANLPLHAAFAAMADECTAGGTKRMLRAMSQRLERGEPPEDVLDKMPGELPSGLGEMVRAGVEVGRLDLVLRSLMNRKQWDLELRHQLAIGLAYPLLLLIVSSGWALGMLVKIAPGYQRMLEDFGTEVPIATRLLFDLSWLACTVGIWLVPLIWIALGGLWCWMICGNGIVVLSRRGKLIPIIGPLFHLRQLSELCDLLAILLEGELPLPKSLRFAAAGTSDPSLREACAELTGHIEQGEPIAAAMNAVALPHSLALILQGPPGEMPREFRALADVYSAKAEIQFRSLLMFVDPTTMIIVSVVLLFSISALLLPMISVLNDLG